MLRTVTGYNVIKIVDLVGCQTNRLVFSWFPSTGIG